MAWISRYSGQNKASKSAHTDVRDVFRMRPFELCAIGVLMKDARTESELSAIYLIDAVDCWRSGHRDGRSRLKIQVDQGNACSCHICTHRPSTCFKDSPDHSCVLGNHERVSGSLVSFCRDMASRWRAHAYGR